ncbi:hypothetical protein M0R45_005090 [Rubus argutus]|uniref:Tubulin-specific chaperone C N-terminal domain-containing protein n=1 Tax=Rubus argutus TaxID=59490 RepID=A0AAW1YLP5_RUBAR
MENEEETEALSSNPTQEALDLDPALQKKRQTMLELSVTVTKLALTAHSLADRRLAQCRLSDPIQIKPQLDQISSSISDLEKLVAENSYFLPSYEVRSSLKAVSDLRQSLENLSAELLPKKKFSFRNKGPKKTQSPSPKRREGERARESGFRVPASPGIWNKKGETLVHNFKGSEVGEFTISDLDSCEVRLMGSVRALFVHRLRNFQSPNWSVLPENERVGLIDISNSEGS